MCLFYSYATVKVKFKFVQINMKQVSYASFFDALVLYSCIYVCILLHLSSFIDLNNDLWFGQNVKMNKNRFLSFHVAKEPTRVF